MAKYFQEKQKPDTTDLAKRSMSDVVRAGKLMPDSENYPGESDGVTAEQFMRGSGAPPTLGGGASRPMAPGPTRERAAAANAVVKKTTFSDGADKYTLTITKKK